MNVFNRTPFLVEAIPFPGPDRQFFLTIVVKGTFTMPDRGPAVVAGKQLPVAFGDEPFDTENGGSLKFESDIAPFKPRADVVLVGHAYAPSGSPANVVDVSLRVGPLQKRLRVFGDRTWQKNTFSAASPSRPAPFDKMPLVYERAFGGIDMPGGGFCAQNLVGRGFFTKPNKKNVVGSRLPNIEDPNQLIRSPKDRPQPVGFGFYGRAWEPRSTFIGTYDEHYRKHVAPGPPPDFKFDYYNGAHPDLQLSGYLNGDETVQLVNLAPNSRLTFQLPGVHPTCVVERDYDSLQAHLNKQKQGKVDPAVWNARKPGLERVSLNLDTLCLLPDDQRLFLLWRGRTAVYDHTMPDMKSVKII